MLPAFGYPFFYETHFGQPPCPRDRVRMSSEPVTTIYFSGGLDIGRYPELHGYFEACPPDANLVLIDLSAVTYVDSVFLTELLVFSKRYERSGAALAVIADGNIARMLTVSGLDKRLHVVQNREAATKFFATFLESAPSRPTVASQDLAPPRTGTEDMPTPPAIAEEGQGNGLNPVAD